MGLIYTLSHPESNEIRYIGYTSKSIEERLIEHISEAKSSKKRVHRLNWIRKLLKKDLLPKVELLDTCTDKNAAETEIYWIAQFRIWGFNLVNATIGGEGVKGYKHSEKSKKRMSESRKGIKKSEEQKLAQSERLKGKRPYPGFIEAAVEATKVKVYQYSLDGDFIKEWNSITEACKFYSTTTSNICACCNEKSKKCVGFIWRYTKNDKINISHLKSKNKKSIYKYSLNDEYICYYHTSNDVSIIENVLHSTILKWARTHFIINNEYYYSLFTPLKIFEIKQNEKVVFKGVKKKKSKESYQKANLTKKKRAEERGYYYDERHAEKQRIQRLGKKHKLESIEKIKTWQKENNFIPCNEFLNRIRTKKVDVFDLDMNFIETVDSIKECAIKYNMSVTPISNMINDRYKYKPKKYIFKKSKS